MQMVVPCRILSGEGRTVLVPEYNLAINIGTPADPSIGRVLITAAGFSELRGLAELIEVRSRIAEGFTTLVFPRGVERVIRDYLHAAGELFGRDYTKNVKFIPARPHKRILVAPDLSAVAIPFDHTEERCAYVFNRIEDTVFPKEVRGRTEAEIADLVRHRQAKWRRVSVPRMIYVPAGAIGELPRKSMEEAEAPVAIYERGAEEIAGVSDALRLPAPAFVPCSCRTEGAFLPKENALSH